MKKEAVSVIIPSFNHASFLKRRIDSVLNQSYDNLELIILDDASTDNSLEIINLYRDNPKIKSIVVNKQNSGSPFLQWQKGLELASADLIWIAESDDWADTFFLQKTIPYFEDINTVLVFTDCKIINEFDQEINNQNPWIHDSTLDIGNKIIKSKGFDFLIDFQRYRNFISNASSVVFRKSASDKISRKFLDFRYSGDWLFWNELLLVGNVVFLPESLCSWRNHSTSTRSIADLSKDYNRLSEAGKVIGLTNKMLPKKPKKAHYDWILQWWLSRYSYKNLSKAKYVSPPIPKSLLLRLYTLLFLRTCKELIHSIKSKSK